jgi:hypothetical protein
MFILRLSQGRVQIRYGLKKRYFVNFQIIRGELSTCKLAGKGRDKRSSLRKQGLVHRFCLRGRFNPEYRREGLLACPVSGNGIRFSVK